MSLEGGTAEHFRDWNTVQVCQTVVLRRRHVGMLWHVVTVSCVGLC